MFMLLPGPIGTIRRTGIVGPRRLQRARFRSSAQHASASRDVFIGRSLPIEWTPKKLELTPQSMRVRTFDRSLPRR